MLPWCALGEEQGMACVGAHSQYANQLHHSTQMICSIQCPIHILGEGEKKKKKKCFVFI